MRIHKKRASVPAEETHPPRIPLTRDLDENLKTLQELYDKCSDFVIHRFEFGPAEPIQACVLFFDGLVSKDEIERTMLQPLLMELGMQTDPPRLVPGGDVLNAVCERWLSVGELKRVQILDDICHHLNSGDTVLLIDGYAEALVGGTRGWAGRGISPPENEVVIQGSKEGFCETLRFNTALLRRRIKTPRLKMVSLSIGEWTRTDVVVAYIDGLASPQLVDEVLNRLRAIKINGILDTGYLLELTEDNQHTIFNQADTTERPDRTCGHLLEGRVAILVDGAPSALIVPYTFSMFFTVGEDYYLRFIPASIFRLLRFLAFLFSITLPAFYVASITYHHELIPSALYLTIAASRQTVPFPALVEALLMEVTFEMLREAGLRLPRAVGPAISIVGALVIGDAAVKAGLVSTPMVVIVAFTGITSYTLPSYNAAVFARIIRFPFLLAGGILGYLGISLMAAVTLVHLSSLQSFGVPFLEPFAPLRVRQLTDTLVRRPWLAHPGQNRQATSSEASTLSGEGGPAE